MPCGLFAAGVGIPLGLNAITARGHIGRLFIALAALDHGRATLVVVVGHLAVETVVALIGIDAAVRVYSGHFAFIGTDLARGTAATAVALEPVEQA